MDHLFEESRIIDWKTLDRMPLDDGRAMPSSDELGLSKCLAARRLCDFLTDHYGVRERSASWLQGLIRREIQCTTACWPGGALLQDFQPNDVSTPIHRSWVDWWAFLAPDGSLHWESLDGQPTYDMLVPVFRRPQSEETAKAYYAGHECLRALSDLPGRLADVARLGPEQAAAVLTRFLLEGRGQRDSYWNVEHTPVRHGE